MHLPTRHRVGNNSEKLINIVDFAVPGRDKPRRSGFIEFTLGDLNAPGGKAVDNFSWNIDKDFIGLGWKLQLNAGNRR